MIAQWINKGGLPNDTYTIQNALIVANSIRAPLIYDPQSIAKNWLQTTFKGEGKSLIAINGVSDSQNFIRVIRLAAKSGKSVLIELNQQNQSSKLSPDKKISLDPILQMLLIQVNEAATFMMDKSVEASLKAAAARNMKKSTNYRNERRGNIVGVQQSRLDSMMSQPSLSNRTSLIAVGMHVDRRKIVLGDEEIDLDLDFKVYIRTKLNNSHFLPQVFMNTQPINFETTEDAMREQLLNLIVKIEAPQLQSTRIELIIQNLSDNNRITKFQDQILNALNQYIGASDSQISGAALAVLDDDRLIEQLDKSKQLSQAIKKRLENNQQTQKKIKNAQNLFRVVSDRASYVYFAVIEHISKLHWMYQFSYDFFLQIFSQIVKDEKNRFLEVTGNRQFVGLLDLPKKQLQTKVNRLLEVVLREFFKRVNRSMFQQHQILLGFILMITLQFKEGPSIFKPAYLERPQIRVQYQPLEDKVSKRSSRQHSRQMSRGSIVSSSSKEKNIITSFDKSEKNQELFSFESQSKANKNIAFENAEEIIQINRPINPSPHLNQSKESVAKKMELDIDKIYETNQTKNSNRSNQPVIPQNFMITNDELQFFLHGSYNSMQNQQLALPPNPDQLLMTEKNWNDFGFLQKLVGRGQPPTPRVSSLASSRSGSARTSIGKLIKVQPQTDKNAPKRKFPFAGLCKDMSLNFQAWFKWLSQEHPQDVELPAPWNEQLSVFQKMMLVRVIRPQNLPFCIKKLVKQILGPEFSAERCSSNAISQDRPALGVMAQLTELYRECTPKQTVLLLVKQGANPATGLRQFSQQITEKSIQELNSALNKKQMVMMKGNQVMMIQEQGQESALGDTITSNNTRRFQFSGEFSPESRDKGTTLGRNTGLHKKKIGATSTQSLALSQTLEGISKRQPLKIISLGQGQGSVAQEAIESALRSGQWIFLQNCHLLPSWHSRLQKIIDQISKGEVVHAVSNKVSPRPFPITPFMKKNSPDRGNLVINQNLRDNSFSSSRSQLSQHKSNLGPNNQFFRSNSGYQSNRHAEIQIHPNFRLFLSAQADQTELNQLLPIEEANVNSQGSVSNNILMNTQKLTVERPSGLKASLQRATAQLRRCITQQAPTTNTGIQNNNNSSSIQLASPPFQLAGFHQSTTSQRIKSPQTPNQLSARSLTLQKAIHPHTHYCRYIKDGSELVGLGQNANSESPLRIAFAICWLHVCLGGRQQFGKLGWNIRYDFSDPDLVAAFSTLDTQLALMISDHNNSSTLFEAMRQIIGICNYGGRVTETQDRNVLNCMIDKYLSDDVLSHALNGQIYYYLWNEGKRQSSFKSNRVDGVPAQMANQPQQLQERDLYRIPAAQSIEALEKYIQNSNLPDDFDEQLMDLGENSIYNVLINRSKTMLSQLSKTEPADVSLWKGGVLQAATTFRSQDAEVDFIAQKFQEEMPLLLTMKEANKDLLQPDPRTKLMKPLDTFLLMQIERFNGLLKAVRRSIQSIRRALKGEILMTNDLDQIYTSFLKGNLPNLWKRNSYLSQRGLAGWFKDLVDRVNYIRQWILNMQPQTFWIPGFFFPQSFITSVLQTASRLTMSQIDTLDMKVTIVDDINSSRSKLNPQYSYQGNSNNIKRIKSSSRSSNFQYSVQVYGLTIQGGRIDMKSKLLVDQLPTIQSRVMPAMKWSIIPNYEPSSDNYYSCPLYRTGMRCGVLNTCGQSLNHVRNISLKSNDTSQKWILRGTALFCELLEN